MPRLDAAAYLEAEYSVAPSGSLTRGPTNTTILDTHIGP